jgi:hypothetical protein
VDFALLVVKVLSLAVALRGEKMRFSDLGTRSFFSLVGCLLILLTILAPRLSGQEPPKAATTAGARSDATRKPADSFFPASTVNEELPNWLRLGGEYRIRPEAHSGYNFAPGSSDGFVLSRLRLNAEVKPLTWFNAFFQAQDSEAIGINTVHITTSIKDVFDLRQAYVEFRNSEKPWFRLRAGRQELRYGQERLIGVSDWTNAPRVFDAFRLTLGSESSHVDVFSSSVVMNHPTSFDNHAGGMNFHGIYGSFSHLVPRSTVEPYVLWKALPQVKSEKGVAGSEDLWTYGFRWLGNLPLHLDYTVEMAKQSGNLSKDRVEAWAGYWIAGYSLVNLPLKPRFSAQYDFASGDKRSGDGITGTFDQLYPSNHGVFGLVDLLGWRNVRQARVGVELKPKQQIKITFNYRDLRLAVLSDALYSSTGSVLTKIPAHGALHGEVGREPDVFVTDDVQKNITVGAGYGYLFPGEFLKENSPGVRNAILYAFATYKF